MGDAFWKENIEARQSKMIGIKQYKLLAYDNNGQFV